MKAVVFHEFGGLDVPPARGGPRSEARPGRGADRHRRGRAQPPGRRRPRGRLALPGRAAVRPRGRGRRPDRRGRRGRRGLGGRRPRDAVPDGPLRRLPLLPHRPRVALPDAAGFISFSTSGGYAEQLVCATGHLMRVPEELSDEAAAALQIAFGTAWHMLFTRGRLAPGETVMINSVGSGIGSAAVQLAHLAGATVIGNASSDEKLARAAELGMDHGINHDDAGRRRGGDAADRRPRRRPRLRARRRRALPEGPRLAREGRPPRHLRRPLGRGRPVRHHPVLPRRRRA